MADPNLGVQTGGVSHNPGVADETIDLTTDATAGPTAGAVAAGEPAGGQFGNGGSIPHALFEPYIPDKQRDYVRLIVTVGLLLISRFCSCMVVC